MSTEKDFTENLQDNGPLETLKLMKEAKEALDQAAARMDRQTNIQAIAALNGTLAAFENGTHATGAQIRAVNDKIIELMERL